VVSILALNLGRDYPVDQLVQAKRWLFEIHTDDPQNIFNRNLLQCATPREAAQIRCLVQIELVEDGNHLQVPRVRRLNLGFGKGFGI